MNDDQIDGHYGPSEYLPDAGRWVNGERHADRIRRDGDDDPFLANALRALEDSLSATE